MPRAPVTFTADASPEPHGPPRRPQELGVAWADLSAAQAGAFPAFSCDAVPAGEPSCEAVRPGSYEGPTASDVDGDGLTDDIDLCPSVFSPLRPMDHGVQPDADGDALGDACDPTPLGTDVDGDGVPNATDVCLTTADADQTDSDGDGKGDACDACATTPNPDRGCP